MTFDVYGNSEPFIKAGKVRVIGIVTPQRSKFLPEVPTLAELGAKGFSMSAWPWARTVRALSRLIPR